MTHVLSLIISVIITEEVFKSQNLNIFAVLKKKAILRFPKITAKFCWKIVKCVSTSPLIMSGMFSFTLKMCAEVYIRKQ